MSISHWGIFPGTWMKYFRDSNPRFWEPWEFDIWDGWQSAMEGDYSFIPFHDGLDP